jgi:hypothetical protein
VTGPDDRPPPGDDVGDDDAAADGRDEQHPSGAGVGAGPRANGTRRTTVALRRLRPPEHGASFWTDLDRRLADEPQLRLAPRAAIRPITQPPPVIDDRNLASSLAAGDGSAPRRSSSRRWLVGVVVAALAVLIVLAAVQGPDDDQAATGPNTTTNTSVGRSPTSDQTATTKPTTPSTLPPGKVDPGTPLAPTGVGPLRIGATLGQLQAAGVAITPDQPTFRGSGGRCYNGLVTGALDLGLRFKPPPDRNRVDNPADGILVAIDIRTERPSTRQSDTGIGLGANQLEILAAYSGNIDERDHPFIPGGKIFRAPAPNGLGIGFNTDGQNIIGIAVGYMDVIRFINDCG